MPYCVFSCQLALTERCVKTGAEKAALSLNGEESKFRGLKIAAAGQYNQP